MEAASGKDGGSGNFLRQFRDLNTREFRRITATQFMDVWNHYDADGNGYIEGKELDKFLEELVTSVNAQDVGPEVISRTAMEDAKALVLTAFDENEDGRIDIAELAQILPMEENFLLLFRRDNPLDSSVEFMKVWRTYDTNCNGYIEADELKNFLHDLLKQSKAEAVTDDKLNEYTNTMLQLFDRNKDSKLQLSEMAKLLPVKKNFLSRSVFKSVSKLTKEDVEKVFSQYDKDKNETIEGEELHGLLKDLMELVQEEYSAQDLEECKSVLLESCDLNEDGKINRPELFMILVSFGYAGRVLDNDAEENE